MDQSPPPPRGTSVRALSLLRARTSVLQEERVRGAESNGILAAMCRATFAATSLVLSFVPALAAAQPSAALGSPSAPTAVDAGPGGTETASQPASLRLDSPLRARRPTDFLAQNPFGVEVLHVEAMPVGRPPVFKLPSLQLGLSYRLSDHFGIGVGSFGFAVGGSTGGNVDLMLQGRPYVEAFLFVDPRVDLYTQIGALVSGQTGSILRPRRYGSRGRRSGRRALLDLRLAHRRPPGRPRRRPHRYDGHRLFPTDAGLLHRLPRPHGRLPLLIRPRLVLSPDCRSRCRGPRWCPS